MSFLKFGGETGTLDLNTRRVGSRGYGSQIHNTDPRSLWTYKHFYTVKLFASDKTTRPCVEVGQGSGVNRLHTDIRELWKSE